ncbi:hypothetical protein PV327_008752 [Microctonus hyperodae]|uniref:Uncharacterized protein n=1 Tax=Microctonus hyperodae TaxID=165561 RepID=A0AA39FT23_MICHY|nr:hypothetical protein PV327_008752 [Microctonus hyperodae]
MDIEENLNHQKVDQACQVKSSDAEVQTNIYEDDIVVIPSQKMNKNKECDTPHKEFVDASVGPDSEFSQCESNIIVQEPAAKTPGHNETVNSANKDTIRGLVQNLFLYQWTASERE